LRPQVRCEKYTGVSFSNNLVVRARWTFQVLQGSVETLLRWGGKHLDLHVCDFVANVFEKLSTAFHQNRPSFIEDITKTFWSSYGYSIDSIGHQLCGMSDRRLWFMCIDLDTVYTYGLTLYSVRQKTAFYSIVYV